MSFWTILLHMTNFVDCIVYVLEASKIDENVIFLHITQNFLIFGGFYRENYPLYEICHIW